MILLDTNVISELMRENPDPDVARWFSLNDGDAALPAIAVAELAFGIAKLPEGARRNALGQRLVEWRLRFADRSPGFTSNTAMLYGEIMANARRGGHNMAIPDAQIAAIALEHDCALATRNGRDFATTSVALINPWHAA
ncbi:type II toxin-antitoxin system VapC family toxin [Phenylobacterium sp.]|uniref:type II toxin-antitoxin system VapC family toxin n=1 Tax=Phenylobacterium sp. TaxID=1871053 RepID=UPI0037C54315